MDKTELREQMIEELGTLEYGSEEYKRGVECIALIDERISSDISKVKEENRESRRFKYDICKTAVTTLIIVGTVVVSLELESQGSINSKVHQKLLGMIPIKIS